MTEQEQEGRAVSACSHCGDEDDMPMHHAIVPDGEGGLTVVSRHITCCAQAGCPDGSCEAARHV